MPLRSKDIDDIFGQTQVVNSSWGINGRLSWKGGGNALTIDPADGIVLKDAGGTTKFSLDMSGRVEGDFIGKLSLSPSQLNGAARAQNGVFLETFEDELTGWTRQTEAAIPTFPPHGQTGGLVVQATGVLKCMCDTKIPYDSSKTYRIKATVKRTAGGTTGKVSVGVQGWGANPYTKVSRTGSADLADPQYVCCYQQTPTTATWTTYKGYFSGWTAAPTQGASDTSQAPKALQTNVRYISPVFHVNDSVGTDTYEIDEISIDVVPADLESGLSAVEVATSLPSSGNYEGRVVYLTTDNKLYRYDGSGWITSVAAADVDADNLAAISADLGTITAGTITGALIRTAASGARVEIDSTNGLRGIDSGGNARVNIKVDGKIYCQDIHGDLGDYKLDFHNYSSIAVMEAAGSGAAKRIEITETAITANRTSGDNHLILATGNSTSYVYLKPNGSEIVKATTLGIVVSGDITMAASKSVDAKTNTAYILNRFGPNFTGSGSPPSMSDGETLVCSCTGDSKYYLVHRASSNYFYVEVHPNSLT